jgi:hypothetical protein
MRGKSCGSTVSTRLVPSAFGLPGQSAARAFTAPSAMSIDARRTGTRQFMARTLAADVALTRAAPRFIGGHI